MRAVQVPFLVKLFDSFRCLIGACVDGMPRASTAFTLFFKQSKQIKSGSLAHVGSLTTDKSALTWATNEFLAFSEGYAWGILSQALEVTAFKHAYFL